MSRGALLTGTAGGIIGTIASVVGIIWTILFFIGTRVIFIPPFPLFYIGPSTLQIFLTIIFVALLAVSCILTGVGFYGMSTVGGGAMGVVGLIFGIIGGVGSAILILVGLTTQPSGFTLVMNQSYMLWNLFGFIILAVSFIIMGSASIVLREWTPYSGTAVAAGILSIIGGVASIILGGIGFVLMFVAFLLWAIVFYTTEA
nr:hypothetical protein [Candidatus Freyarchaeota archaeon]